MENKLNPKQRTFAEHYALTHNATDAAIKAGYSKATARQQAYAMKKVPEVAAYIEFLEKEAIDKLNITKSRILEELEKIAFSNIGDYVSFDAVGVILKDSEELDKGKLAAIGEVSSKRFKGETNVSFKLHSKLDALKTLAAMQGHNAPVKTESKVELEADALTKTVYSNKLRMPDPE